MAKKKEQFKDRLRALRLEAGLTQYALAKKSGLTKQAMSRLERDIHPKWRTVVKLARALGVPLESFLTAEERE
jgi:transcriptional regulator with XRE-family HTH domain